MSNSASPVPDSAPSQGAAAELAAATSIMPDASSVIAIERIAQACSLAVLALSTLSLLLWLLGDPRWIPMGAGVAMAPNTALGLLAAGLALRLHLRPDAVLTPLARLLSLLCLTLGALTLIEYVGDVSLGIDDLLLADPERLVRTGYPGRMTPLTAALLTLAGSALVLLDFPIDRRYHGAQWLSVLLFVLTLLALFGLGYDAPHLLASGGAAGVSPYTVGGALVLSVGIFCARPDRGLASIFSAAGVGGQLARRLVPVAAVAPPALGWLLLQGLGKSWYGVEGLTALTAIVTVLITTVLGWTFSCSLESWNQERVQADLDLRRANARARTFIDANVVGAVIASADGRILEANDHYLRLIGHTRDELLQGKVDWRALTPAEWLPADQNALRELRESGRCTPYEKQYQRRDGSRVWVYLADAVLPDSSGQIAAFVVDITARKNSEQAVRELNATLEQHVVERTAQLEVANKDLEGFAYSVSHDLRAPLRAVDSFSKIVVEDYADKLGAEGQRLLATVRRNAQTMGKLIDDILAFSRAGRKELNRVDVDVAAMAREVLDELLPATAERRIELSVGALPHAQADRAALRQVLVNLLSNAIKFTAPRDAARIELSGAGDSAGVEYAVRDNGVGFDPAYAHKLFGVFQRLHTANEFPGTGIGLAIVKRIIEKHGGRVWAEGAPDQGASFHFALPSASSSAA